MKEVKYRGNKKANAMGKAGKNILGKFGPLFFLLGILIAIVVGLLIGAETIDITDDNFGYISGALAAFGFIVGITAAMGTGTITKEETTQFLIAATALVAVGIAGSFTSGIPLIGEYMYGVAFCMVLFFGPAATIIALKTLWDIGKD